MMASSGTSGAWSFFIRVFLLHLQGWIWDDPEDWKRIVNMTAGRKGSPVGDKSIVENRLIFIDYGT